MKTNASDQTISVPLDGRREDSGLTKREYFAALAMAALLGAESHSQCTDEGEIAELAVYQADALIEKLNTIGPD